MNTSSLMFNQHIEKVCFLNFYLSPINLLKIHNFNLSLTIDQEVKLINEVFGKSNNFQNAKQYISQLSENNVIEFLNKENSSNTKIKNLNIDHNKFKFLKIVITHPLWETISNKINFLSLDLETTHETIQLSQKLDSCFEDILSSYGENFNAATVIDIFYNS